MNTTRSKPSPLWDGDRVQAPHRGVQAIPTDRQGKLSPDAEWRCYPDANAAAEALASAPFGYMLRRKSEKGWEWNWGSGWEPSPEAAVEAVTKNVGEFLTP